MDKKCSSGYADINLLIRTYCTQTVEMEVFTQLTNCLSPEVICHGVESQHAGWKPYRNTKDHATLWQCVLLWRLQRYKAECRFSKQDHLLSRIDLSGNGRQ